MFDNRVADSEKTWQLKRRAKCSVAFLTNIGHFDQPLPLSSELPKVQASSENKKQNKSQSILQSLSANITKWSNTLKQFVGNCLSLFDHFVGLVLKVLKEEYQSNKRLQLGGCQKNEENEDCRISIHEKKKLHFCIAQMRRLMTESSPIPTMFQKLMELRLNLSL